MSLTTTLNAQQPAAGLPITLALQAIANTVSDDNNLVTVGIGTTATNVAPGTFAALAHFQECDINDPFADTAVQVARFQFAAGTKYVQNDQINATKYLRLDSDFAAGKYLWAVVFSTPVPSGTDVVRAHSSSYLII